VYYKYISSIPTRKSCNLNVGTNSVQYDEGKVIPVLNYVIDHYAMKTYGGVEA
jgi:hypothetical protein